MTLQEKTHKLLKERDKSITLMDIANNTGLSYHWVNSFSSGKNKDYAANSIQAVYEFLTDSKLQY